MAFSTYLTARGAFQRLVARPRVANILGWGKLVGVTGSTQVLVQAIGFLCGILVIRLLPTKEYALYTLANTILGTMMVLADGGIINGVLAQGGKVWRDRTRLGVVLATGMDLRYKFAVGSLLVSTPFLLYLLRHHGASWPMAVLLIAALIPPFFSVLSGNLYEIAPRLHQDIIPVQKVVVGINVGRLAMLCLTMFAFPWAFVAILASGIPQVWGTRRIRTLARTYADPDQHPDPEVRREVMGVVKRLLPDAIYYCISGQITIWLVSVVGSTTALADVGALGRLVALLNLVSMLVNTLVTPRFARLPNNSPLLLARYLQLQAGLVVVAAGVVGGCWLFADQLLWLLGKNYGNLQTEMVLNMTGASIGLLYGASFGLCTARGWAIHPLVFIPISILCIIIGLLLFDVSSLKGVIMLNLFGVSVQTVMLFVYGVIRIRRAQREPQLEVAVS
ncbi:MAG TPA: polysaccharide biosynthesis protein [Hymenobacter sp.]